MNNEIQEFCEKHGACADGRQWALTHPSMEAVFDSCERGDWMMWMLREHGALDKPTSVKLACEFALRALPNYEAKYNRKEPRTAIKAALRWLENQTEENASASGAAASAAASAALAASASLAASAAYRAADSAASAASAASASLAASAAYRAAASAALAAYRAAYSAADSAERKIQCDIIRSIVANPWMKQ
jgi:hypothetical protein